MILLQKIIYIVCVLSFSIILILFLDFILLKIIAFYVLLIFFSWLNIVGWTNNILSEASSNSLLFLWLGCLLLFVSKNKTRYSILFCFVTLFFSFTRDSWPYIILCSVTITLVAYLLIHKKKNMQHIGVLFFCIILFLLQAKTSEIGERHKLPVFNSIVGRISKNDTYLNWFKARGMPCSDLIKKDFKNIEVDSEQGRLIVYKAYKDSAYLPLLNWSNIQGKKQYQLFLFFHPSYFFLADQTSNQKSRIFCYGFYNYFKNTSTPDDITQTLFPLWNLTSTLLLSLVLVISAFYFKKRIYFLPFFLSIIFILNAFLLYNADTLEVNRHLYITQIIIQLINLLSISFLVNIFLTLIRNKNQWHLKFIQKQEIKVKHL